MSVYVGIDVHRKRSQVAVVAQDGKVQLNRNVVNGQEPMLRLIGGLPAGTPVAFERSLLTGHQDAHHDRVLQGVHSQMDHPAAEDTLDIAAGSLPP